MPGDIGLYCWVVGDPPQQLFSIMVSNGMNVEGLRDALKAKRTQKFKDFDAETLDLWKVLIPIDRDLGAKLNAIMPLKHDPDNGVVNLWPVDELSEVFPDLPAPKHLHIIVQLPTAGECEYYIKRFADICLLFPLPIFLVRCVLPPRRHFIIIIAFQMHPCHLTFSPSLVAPAAGKCKWHFNVIRFS
jgi:hypothetical protein